MTAPKIGTLARSCLLALALLGAPAAAFADPTEPGSVAQPRRRATLDAVTRRVDSIELDREIRAQVRAAQSGVKNLDLARRSAAAQDADCTRVDMSASLSAYTRRVMDKAGDDTIRAWVQRQLLDGFDSDKSHEVKQLIARHGGNDQFDKKADQRLDRQDNAGERRGNRRRDFIDDLKDAQTERKENATEAKTERKEAKDDARKDVQAEKKDDRDAAKKEVKDEKSTEKKEEAAKERTEVRKESVAEAQKDAKDDRAKDRRDQQTDERRTETKTGS